MSADNRKLLIVGAHPGGNLGAEAMLESLLTALDRMKVSRKFEIILESLSGYGAHEEFFARFGRSYRVVIFRPRNVLQPFNLALDVNDVVIDIGGINYATTDHRANVRNLIRHFYILRSKAKLHFLTQDSGPYESVVTRIIARYVYKRAGSVFLRSARSFEYIQSLLSGIEGLLLGPFPDMTYTLNPSPDDAFTDGNYFVIVPSAIMVNNYGDRYLEVFEHLIRFGEEALGLNPIILIHNFTSNGNTSDLEVGQRLSSRLGHGADVVFEKDPRKCKSIFENADFVLTSRFHALIGALSVGTIPITVGWSHKYKEALQPYNLVNLSLDFNTIDVHEVSALIQSLHSGKDEVSVQIKNTSLDEKKKADIAFKQLESVLYDRV